MLLNLRANISIIAIIDNNKYYGGVIMLLVAATEIKQRLGQYLESAQSEPVIIKKSGL